MYGKRAIVYPVLAVLGVVLFAAASAYCLGVRGYRAVGGEAFLLLLPLWAAMVDLFVTDWRNNGR